MNTDWNVVRTVATGKVEQFRRIAGSQLALTYPSWIKTSLSPQRAAALCISFETIITKPSAVTHCLASGSMIFGSARGERKRVSRLSTSSLARRLIRRDENQLGPVRLESGEDDTVESVRVGTVT